MRWRGNRSHYGFETSTGVQSEPCKQPEVDQLADLVQEITLLFQQDYNLLAIFLRALTR